MRAQRMTRRRIRGHEVWKPQPPRVVAAALVGMPGGGAAAIALPAPARGWSARRRRNFQRHTAVPLLCLVAGAGTIGYGYATRERAIAPADSPSAPALRTPVRVDRPRVDSGSTLRPPTERRPRPAARPKPVPKPVARLRKLRATPSITWRDSQPLGLPYGGRLEDGVQLPPEGRDFVTVDPISERRPNPSFRRWGTDTLVRQLVGVAAAYRKRFPRAARMMVGDLSLRGGGPFVGFGGLGHRSHQNGLDVDIPYPRSDGRETEPTSPSEIDHAKAQALVDLWVARGAEFVFVGYNTGLTGPSGVVQAIANHDDHMHVRIRPG